MRIKNRLLQAGEQLMELVDDLRDLGVDETKLKEIENHWNEAYTKLDELVSELNVNKI